jgi:L-alanine-DL-glutamate epimerase-like enolase superfamily enzyme
MTISRVTLRQLKLPLSKPYRLSYRTFRVFEPILIEVEDDELGIAFGDAHISPGSSAETREGGLAHLAERLPRLIGLSAESATDQMLADFERSKVATTSVVTALEILRKQPEIQGVAGTELPLLTPTSAVEHGDIEAEVHQALTAGYRTFKLKVGKDVDADILRVGRYQKAVAGRGLIRIDANRAYSREQAETFVRGIEPQGIELFEQPCGTDLWDDNAAVAAASDIPVMLDEPICTLADIERAAELDGIRFCKVKLKRFGSLSRLEAGIRQILANGMGAVLGDGLGSDLHGWMEGCVAARCVDNAGEFNGFLKMTGRLLKDALHFENGVLRMPDTDRPAMDRTRIEAATTLIATYS